MSGPIVPPLQVTEVDGSPDGRPITKIVVSNGDLTVSGRTATIDTSGSTSTPGGSDTEVQYNNAGAFGGDSDFTFTGIGGASPTFTITNSASDAGIYTSTRITLDGGTELSVLTTTDGDDGLLLATGADGLAGPFILLDVVTDPSNLLIKNGEEDGTINIQTDSGSGDITLTTVGDLHLIASQTLAFTAATTASVTSTTTNNDMNFNIIANGAGTPLINLKNDTKEVRLTCEDDDKLYVRGPTSGERFTFDASSSTGGITFPDTTTLVSAEGTAILATGVTDGYVLTADGADAAGWEAAGGGGATTLSGLTDVLIDETNFVNSILIQTNSDGLAPTTGTLNNADNNIGIGTDVLQAVTQGSGIVALGWSAAKALTSGAGGVFIGQDAGAAGSPAACVLIGANAGKAGVGSAAIHVGSSSGKWATGINTCVGVSSGENASGSKNCAFGDEALLYVTSGTGNIGIGSEAGATVTTGDYNVIIGKANPASATADSQLSISNGSDGTVVWIVGDDAGSCYQGDNASTWSTTSDQILKREIVDSVTGLDAINAVQIRNFRYVENAEPITETRTNDDGEAREVIVGYDGENRYNLDPEPLRVGVIAQELQEVFPDAVKENTHGHLTVNTDSINWALLKAVQELSAKVEALEAA